jgi:hypothetical protein
LWQAERQGPAGWDYQLSRSKQLADEFATVAQDALCDTGMSDFGAGGCTVASVCGFAHMAEWIHKRVSARGPAWVDPDAFVYSQPHIVTSLACLRLGLGGSTTTMIGPHAGRHALAHALRSLALERQPLHVVGAYEVVSPAGARGLAALGVHTNPSVARAAFAVLAASRRGSVKAMSLRCASDAGARADRLYVQRPRTLDPLLALVDAYHGGAQAVDLAALEGALR